MSLKVRHSEGQSKDSNGATQHTYLALEDHSEEQPKGTATNVTNSHTNLAVQESHSGELSRSERNFYANQAFEQSHSERLSEGTNINDTIQQTKPQKISKYVACNAIPMASQIQNDYPGFCAENETDMYENKIDVYEYIVDDKHNTHGHTGPIHSVSQMVSQSAETGQENSQQNHFVHVLGKKSLMCGRKKSAAVVCICVSLGLVVIVTSVILGVPKQKSEQETDSVFQHEAGYPCNVRKIQGSFTEIMSNKLTQVKTVSLPRRSHKLGVVNGDIWIGQADTSVAISVFDTDLRKIKGYKWKEIFSVRAVQQVSVYDVMIANYYGLYVVHTEGKYQYKIIDGAFGDISISNYKEIAVVEYKQNIVYFLQKEHKEWQIHDHISFDVRDTGLKTLQFSLNDDFVFVGVHFAHTVLKLKKSTGEQQYIVGTESSKLGQFSRPHVSAVDDFNCLVVSDLQNARFQVHHPNETWEEIKLTTPKFRIVDVIVLEDFVFVLFHDRFYRIVFKFKINKVSVTGFWKIG